MYSDKVPSLLIENEKYISEFVDRFKQSLYLSLNEIHQIEWDDRQWSILCEAWLRIFVTKMFCVWHGSEGTQADVGPEHGFVHCIHSGYDDCFNDFQRNDYLHVKELYLASGSITEEKVVIKLMMEKTPDHGAFIKRKCREIIRKVVLLAFCRKKNVFSWGLQFTREQALKFKCFEWFLEHYRLPRSRKGLTETPRRFAGNGTLVTPQITCEPGSFEAFVKGVVFLFLPHFYLENFRYLINETARLGLRYSPQYFLTQVGLYGDEDFKCLVASSNSKLLLMTHHPGTGIGKINHPSNFEIGVATKVLAWGAEQYNPQGVQIAYGFNPPRCLHASQHWRADSRGKILFVVNDFYDSPYWISSMPIGRQAAEYRSYQARLFAKIVASAPLDQVGVRPYLEDYGANSLVLDIAATSGVSIYQGSIDHAINKARLVICTHLNTIFYQCMFSNIPVKLILDSASWFSEEICERLSILEASGVILRANVGSYNSINLDAASSNTWWSSDAVQNSRKHFLTDFCSGGLSWRDIQLFYGGTR